MYAREKQPVADRLAAAFPTLHRAAYHRFYIDEVYQFVTHRVIFACISTPIAWFDRHVVDGFMNLLATATHGAAEAIRFMQSGSVQRYCIWMLGGALGLTILILLIR
jgi:NADH-quinone oxidoreductase subunit L